jgi:hypothetical protein
MQLFTLIPRHILMANIMFFCLNSLICIILVVYIMQTDIYNFTENLIVFFLSQWYEGHRGRDHMVVG